VVSYPKVLPITTSRADCASGKGSNTLWCEVSDGIRILCDECEKSLAQEEDDIESDEHDLKGREESLGQEEDKD
jgi:hypothetical protein